LQNTKKHFSHAVEDIPEKGEVEVNIGGRPFKINNDFVNDFDNTNVLDIAHDLRKPLLIMHAPFDETVPVKSAQELFISAMHPKSFVSLDGADHLLTDRRDSIYAGDVIGSWVKRYFTKVEEDVLDIKNEQVVGHLDLTEHKFTTSIQTRNHTITADEPAEVGGDDFGPSPYELLNAGLAACTVMTMKLYAERKKWDLKEAFVYVTHSKKHVADMEDESAAGTYLDHIAKKIELVGDLDETQREKLKQIASKCPVHRTLQSEVLIDTELVSE
jgi:uncharacterized OsmC-like protein